MKKINIKRTKVKTKNIVKIFSLLKVMESLDLFLYKK
jgi:hypothetical protein